jgi:hypothetical protein
VCNIYGVTGYAFIKFLANQYTSKSLPDSTAVGDEMYLRLQSIFGKNKYGYTTRFMSDFDLLLDALLNERFLDEAALYNEDPNIMKEIDDMEKGLNGEFAESDIKNLLKDTGAHGSGMHKTLQYPGRVGTNYQKSDDLSCYKVHPRGTKPSF